MKTTPTSVGLQPMSTDKAVDTREFHPIADQSMTPRTFLSVAPAVGFVLFILVNGALFIRPSEIVASFKEWPIYEGLFFACLLISFREVIQQLTPESLRARPVTVCVLALLVFVFLSHASGLRFEAAYQSSLTFSKLVLYYLLFVGVVNTSFRLRWFLWCVAVFACIQLGLAVLQHHGAIDLVALRPMEEQKLARAAGETITRYRICGAGIFHDPNDLAMLAAMTIILCLYQLDDSRLRRGSDRVIRILFWLSAIGVSGYALMVTQSRGGFIAFLAGLAFVFFYRFGLKKSILVASITLPVLLMLYSGRQTDIGMLGRTTAQLRLGLWDKGLNLFAHYPVFGVGQGNFAHLVGNVAHNSFIHCYTELGFLGGTLFLGAFYLALWPIIRLRSDAPESAAGNSELRTLRPYLAGVVAAWAVGMLSLSRSYVPPTYMVLGLATVYLGLVDADRSVQRRRVDMRMGIYLIALSFTFLSSMYAFVHLFRKS